jgi:hypothetical protein
VEGLSLSYNRLTGRGEAGGEGGGGGFRVRARVRARVTVCVSGLDWRGRGSRRGGWLCSRCTRCALRETDCTRPLCVQCVWCVRCASAMRASRAHTHTHTHTRLALTAFSFGVCEVRRVEYSFGLPPSLSPCEMRRVRARSAQHTRRAFYTHAHRAYWTRAAHMREAVCTPRSCVDVRSVRTCAKPYVRFTYASMRV